MRLRATRLSAIAHSARLPSAAWTPAELGASLALWLDADDASTITLNGGNVSQWSDKSGNARHATQASASAQPAYVAAGLNGKPIVSFDGTSDFLSVEQFNVITVFLVGNRGSNTGPQISGAAPSNFIPVWNVNGGGLSYRSVTTANSRGVSLGGAAASFAFGCVQLDIDGGRIIMNGNGGATSIFAEAITSADGRLNTLGRDFGGAEQFSNGSIPEVFALSTLPSVEDRQKLEGYLAWKWGGI